MINEALDQYMSLQEYHHALIEQGIREDDAGNVVEHGDVKKMIASLSKKKKKR